MDVEDLQALLSPVGQRLLTRVHGDLEAGADPLRLATRLRGDHPPSLVSAALTQVRLRARAREKFGDYAPRMYFTREGLEQSTRASVAAHRAARLQRAFPGGKVTDLCCGLGGDLLAFAAVGCLVGGIDADPLTVLVARANLEALGIADSASARQGDARTADIEGSDFVFCDPARRADGARVFDPAAYSPPLKVAANRVDEAPGGALKVAPGIPHRSVPQSAEAEWVSDSGEVKEAVLWFGEPARPGMRRATLLPSGATLTRDTTAASGTPPVSAPGRYLFEPDGAIIRAGMVADVAAAIDGALLDPAIAYVTSDRAARTPYARGYEVTDVIPFSLKRLRTLLRARDVGTVTIKKRGSAVDVERLRRDLRLAGSESVTVVLTRIGKRPYALLCRPLPML